MIGVLHPPGSFDALVANANPVYRAANGQQGNFQGLGLYGSGIPADSKTFYSYTYPTSSAFEAGYITGNQGANGPLDSPQPKH